MKWRMLEEKNIADLAIEVFGKNEENLLQNILQAFTSLTTDLHKLKEDKKIEIEITGVDFSELIFNFVEKLIYLKDAQSLLFRKGEFRIEDKRIIADLSGQKITPDLPTEVDIKALTKHKFRVEKNRLYKVNMVFDI